MKRRHFLLLPLVSGLAACGDDKQQAKTTDNASGKELAEQLRQTELPEGTPEVGTAIEDVVKPTVPADTEVASEIKSAPDAEVVSEVGSAADAEVVDEIKKTANEIMWKDLVPDSFKPKAIMQKYQAEIQEIEEGSPEERVLLKKIMAEFDNAPTNEKLNGKRVRIPGFVSPLDQDNGTVIEFLLVPNFGSCIHNPPPPVNQTILVRPLEGKSITLDQIYDPVWVTGNMTVEETSTTLAQAGYLIEDAQLEEYTGRNGSEGEAGAAS